MPAPDFHVDSATRKDARFNSVRPQTNSSISMYARIVMWMLLLRAGTRMINLRYIPPVSLSPSYGTGEPNGIQAVDKSLHNQHSLQTCAGNPCCGSFIQSLFQRIASSFIGCWTPKCRRGETANSPSGFCRKDLWHFGFDETITKHIRSTFRI